MADKQQILKMLKEEYDRWEELLSGLSEAQITDRRLPSGLSIKDVIAHLWAWQQRSVARMEAALNHREPEFPRWLDSLDPDSEENTEPINAWIHETNRDRSWSSVYEGWKAGFHRFMELGELVPEKDLMEPGRYAWLGDLPLSYILEASYNHHQEEHLEPLLAWLRQNSKDEI